jgi:hypothetical protein
MKKPTDHIVIDDLYMASAIQAITGVSPEIICNGDSRVYFRFPSNTETQRVFSGYYAGMSGPLGPFVRTLKTLRAKMYSALRGEL